MSAQADAAEPSAAAPAVRRETGEEGKAQPGPAVRGAQGATLATWDLGGDGPPLLILHATGFHGRCYAPMAADLGAQFHCWALDQRGHGHSGPAPSGDYDWATFAADAFAAIDQLGLERPLVFGHSLGGAVALLAEAAHPGTFAAMHLFEPIVFPSPPPTDRGRGNRLADLARRRRSTFASKAEALMNYAGKMPFARFRADALRAYVDGGLAARSDGTVALRCAREDEALVYEAAPHSGAFDSLGGVTPAVTLACGGSHPDIGVDQLEAMAARLGGAAVEEYPGLSHFGPLEDPTRVAAGVSAALGAPARSA